MKDLNRKMAKGAAWMIAFKIVQRSITLVSTVVLARLLVPADFGLVAMAMAFISILELLTAFSFDIPLIKDQHAERRHYDTAWTFNVLFACAAGAVLMLLAPLAASFYKEPRLEPVMYFLALGTLIQGFENIGVVAFRKELEFRKEFRFQLAKKVVAFPVTMALAFWWRNYWALVAGTLTARCAGVALSYMVNDYRPRFSLAGKDELFRFSKWLFINNALFFLYHRAADFVIGRIAGSHALGLYTIAYGISNMPTTELVAPINRAIFPGYAKMAADLSTLRQGFLNVIGVIAFVSLPIGAGIALLAEPLVRVFLGEKWLGSAPLIQVMALYGMIMALQTNKGSVYLALGRPAILTVFAGLHVALLVPVLVLGTEKAGAMGAAWALLVTTGIFVPFNYAILFRVLRLSPWRFLLAVWRPICAVILMAVTVVLAKGHWAPAGSFPEQAVLLVGLAFLGAIAYVSSVLVLWKLSSCPQGTERFLLDRLEQVLFKKKVSPAR